MNTPSYISHHRRRLIAIVCGGAATITITVVWSVFDPNIATPSASYPLTDFFLRSIGLFFCAVYVSAAAALGWTFGMKKEIAAGMMMPLPIAAVIEVIVDPTSHNLIPFEIILYWLPAFAFAWAGAFFGSAMKKQSVRS